MSRAEYMREWRRKQRWMNGFWFVYWSHVQARGARTVSR